MRRRQGGVAGPLTILPRLGPTVVLGLQDVSYENMVQGRREWNEDATTILKALGSTPVGIVSHYGSLERQMTCHAKRCDLTET